MISLTSTQEAQDQGYQAESGVVTNPHGDPGLGGRRASPGFCCKSAWLDGQAETLDLSLVTLPSPAPHNLQPFMQSCSGTCCSPHPPYPHHFPECPSGEGPTELPIKETETAKTPPLAPQGPGLSQSTPPLRPWSCPTSPDLPLGTRYKIHTARRPPLPPAADSVKEQSSATVCPARSLTCLLGGSWNYSGLFLPSQASP